MDRVSRFSALVFVLLFPLALYAFQGALGYALVGDFIVAAFVWIAAEGMKLIFR